jgi:hypothetical protein
MVWKSTPTIYSAPPFGILNGGGRILNGRGSRFYVTVEDIMHFTKTG